MLNNLGQLALADGNLASAESHYRRALQVATETSSLFEQARALEGTGRCALRAARTSAAAAPLRAALAIYQQLGSPRGEEVAALLRSHDL